METELQLMMMMMIIIIIIIMSDIIVWWFALLFRISGFPVSISVPQLGCSS